MGGAEERAEAEAREARSSREGEVLKSKDKHKKGESDNQMGCRAPQWVAGPTKDLPSDFQVLSTPSLLAGPDAALGRARRLTPRDLPRRAMGPRSHCLGLSRLGLLLLFLLPLLPGTKLSKPGLASLGVAAVLVLSKYLSFHFSLQLPTQESKLSGECGGGGAEKGERFA